MTVSSLFVQRTLFTPETFGDLLETLGDNNNISSGFSIECTAVHDLKHERLEQLGRQFSEWQWPLGLPGSLAFGRDQSLHP